MEGSWPIEATHPRSPVLMLLIKMRGTLLAKNHAADWSYNHLVSICDYQGHLAMGQNLCLHFGADEHPCATYFDVHQGYRVLTHSHMLPHRLSGTQYHLRAPGPLPHQAACALGW